MNHDVLSPYGLKFHPFIEAPAEALFESPPVKRFIWRVQQLGRTGGFAVVCGPPGSGKSAILRMIEEKLANCDQLHLGVLTRPQSSLADFYRELGAMYGVPLKPHNRWNGSTRLRETWKHHIDGSLLRPLMLIDEAQEMNLAVLNELRLLTSARLDSRVLLTVLLAGDERLVQRFDTPELAPLFSRMRVRLNLDSLSADEIRQHLIHLIRSAGSPALMTPGLIDQLSEAACGNLRAMANMAAELLEEGARGEATQLDEQLFLKLFGTPQVNTRGRHYRRRRNDR